MVQNNREIILDISAKNEEGLHFDDISSLEFEVQVWLNLNDIHFNLTNIYRRTSLINGRLGLTFT